jgi:WD40 repeat protein/serine/threonine protein kinase
MINDAIGKVIKSYQVEGLVGEGGFGAVYRARQAIVEREVAIKVIWPAFANHPNFIRRFEAEAQLVAGLEHPHIVPLYDYWRDPEGAYIVMRYLKGGPLTNLMNGRQWSLPEVNRILGQITSALALAHRYGVVHRDIKPANILLDEDNNAYLADFGIAQIMSNSQTDDMAGLGSPAYAAPEQIVGGITSLQSDIYSLGVILYELLAGQHPFPHLEDLSVTEVNELRANAKLPTVMDKRSDLPRAINDVLQRATALDPKYRYADAESLARAFQDASGSAGRSNNGYGRSYPMLVIPNPYKGLRAFQESDAQNFFGRESLVQRLINRMRETGEYSRFLAVVGPSGSGKSSVVRAGLIPALRDGAVSGSEDWYYDQVILGADPFSEIENTLVGLAVNPPENLRARLLTSEDGLHNAVNSVLPDDGSELLLFIDQFEEIFTLNAEPKHFLQSLYVAVTQPKSRLRVIITIRADFYDRPLMQVRLSDMMRERTEVVVPLSPTELERVILEPARRVGVIIDHGLVAAIVNEVKEQPSSLPLLQYTLSELFEKREGSLISPETYKELGGVRGSLARRADEIYSTFTEAEREAMRQLFLRLITLGEGTEDTRRRALLNEVTSLRDKDDSSQIMKQVIEKLGKARLISFDRDPITRSPTLEVTHEAIIREWNLLRDWLDEARQDVRFQRTFSNLTNEWDENGREPSFLMTGARLESYEKWALVSRIALTELENHFLLASITSRNQGKEEERNRKARLRLLERQSFYRARYLALVLAIATIVGFALTMFAFLQSNRAGDEARRAEDALEISQSTAWEASARQAQSSNERDLAILLALQAVSIENPPSQAINTLTQLAFNDGTRAVLRGHSARVQDVAISPDMSLIASASIDGSVILWDATSGEILKHLYGHGGDVDSVSFSPDGQSLLSAAADFTAILWDVQTGEQLQRFLTPAQPMRDAEFSPDGSQILTASNNGLVILWDITTGQEIRRFEGHGAATVLTVAFSPDGLSAMSGARDGRLFVWDIATGQAEALLGHSSQVNDVEYSDDGRFAISASGDGIILLWDMSSRTLVRQFLGSRAEIRDLSFSNDGTLVYAASLSGAVLVFDSETGLIIETLRGHTGAVTNIEVSRNGQILVTGSEDTTLRTWNIGLPAVENFLFGHERRVQDIAYHENRVYSVSVDNTLKIWEEGELVQSFTLPDALFAISLSADANTALLASREGAYLLNLSTGDFQLLAGQLGRVNDVILLANNRALGAAESEVILWHTESGEILQRFPHNDTVNTLALMPSGEQFLSGSANGNLSLWNLATGLSTISFIGHEDPISSVAISPDGLVAASASRTGDVIFWDIATGTESSRIVLGSTGIWSISFNAIGDTLAIGATEGLIILWDRPSHSEIARYDLGTSSVFALAFSADGQHLATGQDDNSVLLWRVYRLEELVAWVRENRYLRAWHCVELEQYHLPEGSSCES